MEKWQWTALILCAFGLFKEFRPSEPFVTDYILEYKNVTKDELVHIAYPVSTYSYLGTLAIVFLITDFFRYRSIVILEGISYVATWSALIWGNGLTALLFVEVLYGLASSTEVAYYTYIYAKVDRDKYKKVTSYTYSAILLGRFFAAVTSQLLVSYDVLNYHELNYVSLASLSLALLCSLCLPGVKQSIYFYRKTGVDDDNNQNISNSNDGRSDRKLTFFQRVKTAYPILWKDFKQAFSNPYVLKWSIWWAVATAGHLQVMNYIQAMWETIVTEDQEIYNGAVESIHTLLSALLAFGVGHVKLPWAKWGETFLGVTSIIQGVALIILSQTSFINVAYATYILFRTIFQVTITIASAEVAQGISEDSYGLIFGVNTFIALALQTILTVVVVDQTGLALGEPDQFLVYGGCFAVLGILLLFVAVYTFCTTGVNIVPKTSPNSSSTDDLGQLGSVAEKEEEEATVVPID